MILGIGIIVTDGTIPGMIPGTDGMLPITVMAIIAGTTGVGVGTIITPGFTLVIIMDIITILVIMVEAMYIIRLILLTEMVDNE